MTIEEEIRQRLRAMGMDEESVEPCLEYVKDDPFLRGMHYCWEDLTTVWSDECMDTFAVTCKSSALDYLEKKYHVEARKSPVAMNNDGE